jgi:uncharacterized protein
VHHDEHVKRWGKRIVLLGLVLAVGLYSAKCAWFYSKRQVILFGARPGKTEAPKDFSVEKTSLANGKNEISIWDVAPNPSAVAATSTVLYLHGTDINLANTLATLNVWRDLGYRVIAFDYRGFGESTGSPTSVGLVDDAQVVLRWMVSEKKIAKESIIVHGHSLGTGVAIQLGVREPLVQSLLLEGAFANVEEILAYTWGRWYPWRLLAGSDHDAFNSIDNVSKLTMPVLVTHGLADTSVPIEQGERIAARVRCGAPLFIPGKGHNDVFPTMGASVLEQLLIVTKRCRP